MPDGVHVGEVKAPHSAPSHTLLSIVITSWNTRELLRELLQSLRDFAPGRPYEVLVVDNASSDGSARMVQEDFPEVVLLGNTENLGYARANNQGIQSARGSYVLLLGSDTRLIARTFDVMIDFLEQEPSVGAVGCRLLNPDRTPQISCRRFPTLRDAVVTYCSLHLLAPGYTMRGFRFDKTQPVDQPAATCFMMRREVLDTIGGFDERYTILYSDVDLCRRIHAAGWSIYYLADAEIVHYGSRSTSQATPEIRLEMYRNIIDYYTKSAGPIARWVLWPILQIRLLLVTRSLMALRLSTYRKGDTST